MHPRIIYELHEQYRDPGDIVYTHNIESGVVFFPLSWVEHCRIMEGRINLLCIKQYIKRLVEHFLELDYARAQTW